MRISICTPTHNIPEKDFFLKRIEQSLKDQTFGDFEWIVTEQGKMAENTNAAMKLAKGDIVKILYMDDCLAHKDSLLNISNAWKGGWLVTGCDHQTNDGAKLTYHKPVFDLARLRAGLNSIGSPSVLAMGADHLWFDEKLSWMLDCELYVRLYEKFGEPTMLDEANVTIGIGEHQMTHKLTDAEKLNEHNYHLSKHA